MIKNISKYFSENPILFIIFLSYFISRMIGLYYFVPHNDEAIYTHVAMKIARDWETNKYLSLNGSLNYDYKMPLQFWANSLTVNWWKNPLIGVRIWSILLGFCGLFFTQLLVRRIWSKTAALITAGMIVISEYYFYFDLIGLNEVFLYGLGAAYLFFLYEALVERRWISGGIAGLLLAAVFISKTSGILWALYAALIPLLAIATKNESFKQMGSALKREGFRLYSVVVGTIAFAQGISFLLIPREFDAVKAASFQKGLVRGMGEIIEFPWAAWMNNLKFYGTHVLGSEFFYLPIPLLGICLLATVWLIMKKSSLFWRYLILIGLYCFSLLPLLIIAKAQAVRYFGMGHYFLFILIAIAVSMIWERLHFRFRTGMGLLVVFLIIGWKTAFSFMPLVQWGQTELALKETPPSWSNGAGIMELVDEISKLSPGMIMVDSQWGLPLTAIQIFYKYYSHPGMKLLNPENLEKLPQFYQQLPPGNQNLYFIVDARTPGERPWIDQIINTGALCDPKKIIQKRYKDQIFNNTALVICQAKVIPSSIKIVR